MMNAKSTRVSIIMGIYNCADTLHEAIQSILEQTFSSWELIMCDDGSSDDTYTVAQIYQNMYPDKIKLLRNNSNMGLNHTLNRCLELVKGEYIARQDGDDMSLPHRFEVQLKAFEQYPEVAIVSSSMALFDNSGEWGNIIRKPFPQKKDLVNGTPFAHAPCLVRADALRAVGGYSEHKCLIRVEDYHLWYKMYNAGYRGMNLEEVLYRCRDDQAAQKRRKFKYRINECYVRWLAFKDFHLPLIMLPVVIKPLLIGLLPTFVYRIFHKSNLTISDHSKEVT